MAKKKKKLIIWLLAGSCVLNLIFAINAGQKRKAAEQKLSIFDARCTETDLRYKNAIQSYDAVEKSLREAKTDLERMNLFSESLKEALQEEQKKSQALRQELENKKLSGLVINGPEPVKQPLKQPSQGKQISGLKGVVADGQVRKSDRTSRRW